MSLSFRQPQPSDGIPGISYWIWDSGGDTVEVHLASCRHCANGVGDRAHRGGWEGTYPTYIDACEAALYTNKEMVASPCCHPEKPPVEVGEDEGVEGDAQA
jgi:hypothetical protein